MKNAENLRILIPTDFSDCAYDAARAALDFTGKCGCALHFFHNCNTPYSESHLDEIMQPYENLPDAYAIADQLFSDFLSRLQGDEKTITRHIGSGDLTRNINKLVRRDKFDLIIMGSHGAGGWKELLYGSNAQKVVQQVTYPVLTIKKYRANDFKNIIFLTNLNSEASIALAKIASFGRLFGSKLHIVHIKKPLLFHEPQPMIDYAMHELTRDLDMPFELYDFPDFSIESGLEHLYEQINPDLIAVGTYGRGKLSTIFRHSVTQALVNHFDLPIMSVNFEVPE